MIPAVYLVVPHLFLLDNDTTIGWVEIEPGATDATALRQHIQNKARTTAEHFEIRDLEHFPGCDGNSSLNDLALSLTLLEEHGRTLLEAALEIASLRGADHKLSAVGDAMESHAGTYKNAQEWAIEEAIEAGMPESLLFYFDEDLYLDEARGDTVFIESKTGHPSEWRVDVFRGR